MRPADPRPIAVRADRPGGSFTGHAARSRARCAYPPQCSSPTRYPVETTASPGSKPGGGAGGHRAGQVDAGHVRVLLDQAAEPVEDEAVLVVEGRVFDRGPRPPPRGVGLLRLLRPTRRPRRFPGAAGVLSWIVDSDPRPAGHRSCLRPVAQPRTGEPAAPRRRPGAGCRNPCARAGPVRRRSRTCRARRYSGRAMARSCTFSRNCSRSRRGRANFRDEIPHPLVGFALDGALQDGVQARIPLGITAVLERMSRSLRPRGAVRRRRQPLSLPRAHAVSRRSRIALYRLMEDPDPRVRKAAWHTLQDGGYPKGDARLDAILKRAVESETDKGVRNFIAEVRAPPARGASSFSKRCRDRAMPGRCTASAASATSAANRTCPCAGDYGNPLPGRRRGAAGSPVRGVRPAAAGPVTGRGADRNRQSMRALLLRRENGEVSASVERSREKTNSPRGRSRSRSNTLPSTTRTASSSTGSAAWSRSTRTCPASTWPAR